MALKKKRKNKLKPDKKYFNKNFQSKSNTRKKRSPEDGLMRLNQYLAHAGICSRREADQLIEAGVVSINGKAMTQMGYRVHKDDIVKFNGRTLKTDKKKYLLLNKPRNYSCRIDDFGKKDSVFNLVKGACKEKILPLNKLNKKHSGLLILTNDEKISAKLSNPKHKAKKIYHISLSKPLKSFDFKKLKDGLIIDGEKINLDSISYVKNKEKTEIGIETKSNKRNIISKIFESLSYNVVRLDLVFYAGLTKKDITRKKYRFLSEEEINLLKRI